MLKIVRTSRIDSIRTDAAMNIILTFGYMSPDSVLFYSEKLKIAGRESHFPPAEALGYANIGFALKQLDYRASALENSIKALKIAENHSNYRALSMVYDVLGIVYPVEDPKRLSYLFKALEVSSRGIDHKEKTIMLTNIGTAYYSRGILDSALIYQQQAYELLIRKDKIWDRPFIQTAQVWVLTGLGRIHSDLGNIDLASTYYRMALNKATSSYYDVRILYSAYRGMADFFQRTGAADSAFFYNQKIFKLAGDTRNSWKVNSADYLYKYFKGRIQTDSALKYLEARSLAISKIDSSNQLLKVQSLSFLEDLRQKERLAREAELSAERKNNLQYAAIAFGLVCLIISFLLLSRSIITSTRVIRFFGVITLLICFEFLNLLLHPFFEKITNHSPILTLLALVCIAALLVPLHHRVEKWTIQKLVEKNKQIRLENARKTIVDLEPAVADLLRKKRE